MVLLLIKRDVAKLAEPFPNMGRIPAPVIERVPHWALTYCTFIMTLFWSIKRSEVWNLAGSFSRLDFFLEEERKL